MREIFISYRRKDTSDITGRIFDHLRDRYGQDSLFKDVDSIPLGADFRSVIDQAVGECSVLLAVIGDDWLLLQDAAGNRRIDLENDFVRAEIEFALKRKIPVIPVLVEGQPMPEEKDLPPSLQELAFRNAINVRPDPDFKNDMNRLYDQLDKYVGNRRKIGTVKKAALFILVIILVVMGISRLQLSENRLTPAEIKIYQRHLAIAKAFEDSQVWKSALENYEKAAEFRPEDRKLQEAINRIKSKIK